MGEFFVNRLTGQLIERKAGNRFYVRVEVDADGNPRDVALRPVEASPERDRDLWEYVGYADYRYYRHDPHYAVWRCRRCGAWRCTFRRYGWGRIAQAEVDAAVCDTCLTPDERAALARREKLLAARQVARRVRRWAMEALLGDAVRTFSELVQLQVHVSPSEGVYVRIQNDRAYILPTYPPRIVVYPPGSPFDGAALCADVRYKNDGYAAVLALRVEGSFVPSLVCAAGEVPKWPGRRILYPRIPAPEADRMIAFLKGYEEFDEVLRLILFVEKRKGGES